MVVAISGTTPSSARQNLLPSDDANRSPLARSESDNAVARRPKGREINSRYLSSHASKSSASSSSWSSSSSSSSSRRCSSPARPKTPSPNSVLSGTLRRSQSAERRRSTAPTPSVSADLVKRAAPEVHWPTTRSLSVSFQGESFTFPIGRRERPAVAAKVSSPAFACTVRRSSMSAERSLKEFPKNSMSSDSCKVGIELQRRWPGVSSSSVLTRSFDFTDRLHQDPSAGVLEPFEEETSVIRRASFDGPLDLGSDTESVSSGGVFRESWRSLWPAMSMPARLLQGATCGRAKELGSSPLEINAVKLRIPSSKKSSDSPSSSPRSLSSSRSLPSPIRGSTRPASPSKLSISSCPPSKGMPIPLRTRASSSISDRSCHSASSIFKFFDARKVRKGVNLIEDAHLLRLLYNRYLQWRFVNARASSVFAMQRLKAERAFYNAWITISKLRESIMFRKTKLQQLKQHTRLTAILHGQMFFLEEWVKLDREYSCSLSGVIESLKTSTLRLPIVGCAKADIYSVKETVYSAVDVMQTMGSSICHLLSKVEGISALLSELVDVAVQGQASLDLCTDLLLMAATLQVEECSMRTHLLQLKRIHEASHNMRREIVI